MDSSASFQGTGRHRPVAPPLPISAKVIPPAEGILSNAESEVEEIRSDGGRSA